MKKIIVLLSLLAAIIFAPSCANNTSVFVPLPYRGTNLDGGQFGTKYPGVEGVDYSWPTNADVDYLVSKNMNTFRVGFQWERLQPVLKGPFAPTYFAKLDALVKYANAKGVNVFLNPHNYARYQVNGTTYLVGSNEVPYDAFADLWTRLATQYKGNSKVMFSLVNEPHDMPTGQWVNAANAAIKGIRSTGNNNLVSVPGNAWTGAAQWSSNWGAGSGYDVANSVAMLNIQDSASNYAFEVHNYFDSDGGGAYNTDCVNTTAGQQKLANVTSWARTNKKKVLVGEFGTPATSVCEAASKDMLKYIHDNQDVYIGWLWWSAGTPWGTNYKLNISPKNGVEDARMAWLTPYLPKTTSVPVPAPAVSPSYPSSPISFSKSTVFTTNSGTTNWVYVPSSYDSTHNTPTRLFVWLHGCGGKAQYDIYMVSPGTNQSWISLAVGGREGACWSDVSVDGSKILAAIADVKSHFNVDPRRVVLGGYSSGGDIGYPLLFQNAKSFAGGIFENTGPSTTAMTNANSAAWKVNIAQLSHTSDTTYPIASIKSKMTALKNAGFPVNFIEKPGTHWDNDNGTTGTQYDFRTFLLPFLNVDWAVPVEDAGAPPPPVDAGVPSVDAGVVSLPFKVVERTTYNWTSGYCKEFDLVNPNKTGTLTWSELQLNLRGGTVRDPSAKGPPWDTWGGTFSARTGVVKVVPLSWNKTVSANAKATIGFCADFGTQVPVWTATYVSNSLK